MVTSSSFDNGSGLHVMTDSRSGGLHFSSSQTSSVSPATSSSTATSTSTSTPVSDIPPLTVSSKRQRLPSKNITTKRKQKNHAHEEEQTRVQDAEEDIRAPQKQATRRSCDPCRLRRVRCVKQVDSNDCDKCIAMGINCTESAPRARTSQKGTRIAQAKILYGDTTGASALALIKQAGKAMSPSIPPESEGAMVSAIDISLLLSDLIPSVAKLRVARVPLLRWIDINGEFEAAEGKISNMDNISQALFLSLAALSARTSNSEIVVGKKAPTLMQVLNNDKLRSSVTLCKYGKSREDVARELLNLAYKKLNENQVLVTPSLRSVAALATVETLMLVYSDSLAFSRDASRRARPLSAVVASHLRILAEECDGLPTLAFSFYSVAWTAIIRDALVAAVTGKPLDFTIHDIFLLLKINEDEPMTVPSAQSLFENWLMHPWEGPVLMQLWGCILVLTRSFVNAITQPLAVARERLNIAFFDRFWVKMAECRSALCDSIELWKACGRQPQEQKHVIAYAMEFVVAQAHRSIAWRCSEEQLARAQSSSSSSGSGNRAPGSGGMYKQSWELYKEDLQALRLRSTEEAFAAARRIIPSISSIFSSKVAGKADFFIPGFFISEGLLVWASLLMDIRSLEEGGRQDYGIVDKLKDLNVLKEAIAITGWSNGLVQPHLEQLNNFIFELERKRENIMTVQIPTTDLSLFTATGSQISGPANQQHTLQSTLLEPSQKPASQFHPLIESHYNPFLTQSQSTVVQSNAYIPSGQKFPLENSTHVYTTNNNEEIPALGSWTGSTFDKVDTTFWQNLSIPSNTGDASNDKFDANLANTSTELPANDDFGTLESIDQFLDSIGLQMYH